MDFLNLNNTPQTLNYTISSYNLNIDELLKWKKSYLIICAWILLEFDRFCSSRIDNQRTSDFLMMPCPYQFPHHITSRSDFKLQHKRYFNASCLWNCYGWSSSIKGNLITFQVHWYNTVTLSWLIVFLQLQKVN